MVRALLLVLAAIACGLGGTVPRAGRAGRGRRLQAGRPHRRPPAPAARPASGDSGRAARSLLVVLLVSLDLYGSEELSQVVPLYSLSYVLIALIGQLFLGERVTLQRWVGILTHRHGRRRAAPVVTTVRTAQDVRKRSAVEIAHGPLWPLISREAPGK